MLNSSDLNLKINQEVSKSFRNVNYSQWERQSVKQSSQTAMRKPVERQSTSSLTRARPTSTQANDPVVTSKTSESPSERKTFQNPRKVTFKSRKQQIEEEARRNLLKSKIKFTKQNILGLKDRVSELTEMNLDIIEYIDKSEKTANDTVDGILRKYERYQDVLKTINKKHSDEMSSRGKELKLLKKDARTELPKYAKSSDQVEGQLSNAQKLSKQLSIYKNQEYPEKILQINNLRKNLDDIKNFQNEEKEAFLQMAEEDRDRERAQQAMITENIANKLTTKVVDEMHFSLKEMAMDNESMKEEIEFFTDLLDKLNDETDLLDKECIILKDDRRRRNNKAVIYEDVFLQKKICTPDMDVVLDLNNKEMC